MNTFNRIFMTLLGLVIFAFGFIPFLLLTGLVAPGQGYLRTILALYNAWRAVALLRGATTNIAVLVALILMLIGLVLVILELLPLRRAFSGRSETKQYVVRDDALGQVTLGRSMVRDFVRHVGEAVPGVAHVEPEVKDTADGLQLVARVSLAWDADAPAVGQLLQERLKESVQTQLGLPVASVQVVAQSAPVVKTQSRRVARVA